MPSATHESERSVRTWLGGNTRKLFEPANEAKASHKTKIGLRMNTLLVGRMFMDTMALGKKEDIQGRGEEHKQVFHPCHPGYNTNCLI